MSLYYFNVRNGIGLVEDEEGCELASLEQARAEAVRGARSIIADEVLQGKLDLSGSIEVLDEAGELLFALSFGEAVTIVS